jgi:membrane protein required for colicin V production
MINLYLNIFDYCLLSIIVISTILGLFRGFMKELISLLAFCAALVVSLLYSKKAAIDLSPYIHHHQTAYVISFILIFIGTLIIGALVNFIANKIVKGTGLSFVNRVFGGVFGAGRGIVISILILLFCVQTGLQRQFWFKQSTAGAYYFQMAIKLA